MKIQNCKILRKKLSHSMERFEKQINQELHIGWKLLNIFAKHDGQVFAVLVREEEDFLV